MTALDLTAGNFAGVISGAGQVDIVSSTSFAGANLYTGGTFLTNSGAVLTLAGSGSITGKVVFGSGNTTLEFQRSSDSTFGGVISGFGAVLQDGPSTLTLTGQNTYAGGTSILTGSTLVVGNSSAVGTGDVTLSSGGELRGGSGAIALGNTVDFVPSTLTATLSATTGGTFTLNSLDTSNTSALTVGSAGHTGTVVIGSSVTAPHPITVTVAFGTLLNGGGLGAITGNGGFMDILHGATLALNDHSITLSNLDGNGAVTLGKLAATNLTLGSVFFGGTISGAGQVTVAGSVTLTGANTYTGGTTVADGSSLTLNDGLIPGTAGTVVGGVALQGSGMLVFERSTAGTFANVISGTGGVVQGGPGVTTFTAKNTYSGGTTVGAGTLVLTNANAAGTGAVTIGDGAELRGSGTVVITNAINFAPSTTNAFISAAMGGTFTISQPNTANTLGLTFGTPGQTGTVVIPGLVMDAPVGQIMPVSTAALTVAFGTLKNGGGLGLLTGSATSVKVNAGATLAVNDLSLTTDDLEGSGNVTLGTKAATTLTLAEANSAATFGGVISGAGQVILNATQTTSTFTLTGTNTYTGGTTVTAGTLEIGNGGATGSIVGNISGDGSVRFNRGNTYTFGGVISGNIGVLQYGDNNLGTSTAVLTLGGNNTYTGGTILRAGTLVATNAHSLGSGAVLMFSGTKLRGMGTFTLANTVNFGSGTTGATLSAAMGGTFTLTALDTTNTAALTFGSPGNTGTVALGSTVTPPNAPSLPLTVAFGTLQNGTGLNTLLLNAPSLTVNAGATFAVNDLATSLLDLEGSGNVTLGKNAATVLTLKLQSTSQVFNGVISGSGAVNFNAANIPDTLTLTGANTYTGGTAINAGTLILGNGGTTGSIVGSVTDSGDLAFDRSDAVTFAGAISGGGRVDQLGSGVLTLTGNNTYVNGTHIEAGTVVAANAHALGNADAPTPAPNSAAAAPSPSPTASPSSTPPTPPFPRKPAAPSPSASSTRAAPPPSPSAASAIPAPSPSAATSPPPTPSPSPSPSAPCSIAAGSAPWPPPSPASPSTPAPPSPSTTSARPSPTSKAAATSPSASWAALSSPSRQRARSTPSAA